MSQLLQNAVYGTALIFAAALLRRALGDRLAPEARLALWAVCLFRLLTPAAPESVLSLWGPLSRLFQAINSAAAAPPTPQLYVLPRDIPAPEPGIAWETALSALWLAVGAALAARYVLSWRRTRRAVACAIPLDRSDGRYAALPKCARLREGAMEGAPLTFGALRPTVVLSPGLEGAELDCVLAHEGVHASRRDNLWHYAMALAAAVHWWNPAVWLMARLLRRDIELSCDRAALRKLGADRRAEYARTLVSLATQTEGPAFCQTFGRKAAEERIRSIMKFKKASVIGVIFTLTLVLAVTAAFASEPKTTSGEYDSVKAGEDIFVMTNGGIDSNPDLPTYTSYGNIEGEIMGELDLSRGEAGPAISYSVLTPDHVEDDGTAEDVITGDIAPRFYSYSIIEDGETAAGIIDNVNPRVYLYSLCADADCDVADPHVHLDGQVIRVEYENPLDDIVESGIISTAAPDAAVPQAGAPSGDVRDESMADVYKENGYPVDNNGCGLVYGEDGEPFMKARWGYLPCIRTDCAVSGAHYHANGRLVLLDR